MNSQEKGKNLRKVRKINRILYSRNVFVFFALLFSPVNDLATPQICLATPRLGITA